MRSNDAPGTPPSAPIDWPAVFDALPRAALLLSPDLVVVAATEAFLALTRRPRDAIVGRSLAEAFPDVPADPSDGRLRVRETLEEVRRTLRPLRTELRHDLKRPASEGGGYEERRWSVLDTPILGPDGALRCIVHVIDEVTARARDASERARLSADLAEAEDRLELALESGRMGTWHVDLRTGIVTMSRSAAAMFGAPEQGVDVTDLIARRIHPDDQAAVTEAWDASVGRLAPFAAQYRIVLASGEVRWMFARGTVRRGPDGEATAFAGVLGDLTERIEAEVALATERHTLAAIFRLAPAAMVLWRGRDLVFEKVNPQYQAIFPDRDLQDRPLLEAVPELRDQPFAGLLLHVLDTGEPFVAHEMLARLRTSRDGPLEDRYYDFTYVRVDDVAGRPYGVLDHAIDVTDRVLARRSLDETTRRLAATVADLEQERELREQFVAMISHDLRTPMAAAQIQARLLGRKAVDPEIRRTAARISDNLGRADRMLRDLLDAYRVEAGGRVAIEPVPCDLAEVARSAIDDLESLHGPRFVLDAAPDVRGEWDCSAVRRIVENLVGNAVKYGEPDAPITVRVRRDGAVAELAVHNDGTPIPSDEQATLFEAFRRASSAERGKQTGWGLGLTLVRGLAEAHDGTVLVRSEAGEGTTFVVALPLVARAPDDARPDLAP